MQGAINVVNDDLGGLHRDTRIWLVEKELLDDLGWTIANVDADPSNLLLHVVSVARVELVLNRRLTVDKIEHRLGMSNDRCRHVDFLDL